MKITFLGLSLSSSWGNGHATTYRGLIYELAQKGHQITFLERDVSWYRDNRDLENPSYCQLKYYGSPDELKDGFRADVSEADVVILGSYVPNSPEVAEWVLNTAQGITAFYDIDTPVTLFKLDQGDYEYLAPGLVPRFDLYLSFSGGKVLELLEKKYKAKKARALYCSFDAVQYYPEKIEEKWLMGYLGTYSDDRQPTLEELLIMPASSMKNHEFIVAGPGYPKSIGWPGNVMRIDHLAPDRHRDFYNSQRFTLNVTRKAMRVLGYSPSVRLFEAAACGTAIISDWWEGLDQLFVPGEEILIAQGRNDCLGFLQNSSEERAGEIGQKAREKVLKSHTARHRADELESYVYEVSRQLV